MEWGNSGAVCGFSVLEECLGLSAAECPIKSSEVIRQGPPGRLGVLPFFSVGFLSFPYSSAANVLYMTFAFGLVALRLIGKRLWTRDQRILIYGFIIIR
jgi:hypothetical protein